MKYMVIFHTQYTHNFLPRAECNSAFTIGSPSVEIIHCLNQSWRMYMMLVLVSYFIFIVMYPPVHSMV